MEQYHVVLESQLGPREGTLRLEERNGIMTGAITLLGCENPAFGERTGDHAIRLSHHLHTQISDLSCVSVFEMDGDIITGFLQSGREVMKWHGEIEPGMKGGDAENGGE